jgi:hypothetical protein
LRMFDHAQCILKKYLLIHSRYLESPTDANYKLLSFSNQ